MGKLLPAILAILLFAMAFIPASSASTQHIHPSTSSNAATKTPIKHVVEIIMENRAFDSMFGVYPFVNGLEGGNPQNLTVPLNLLSLHDPSVLKELKAVPNGTYTNKNPVEGYIAYHGDINNGRMNGFLNYSGPSSMNYYTAAQLAPLWDIAEQYALADNYYASVLSQTTPNRLTNIAGFSPVINDYGPPPYIPFNETIFGELQNSGISWSYYVQHMSKGAPTLSFIQGIHSYPQSLQSWSSFFGSLQNNTLPAVSYFMPIGGGADGYDMGSPENVLQGELWLLYTLTEIMKSPEWNSTAVFLTFDEGGGMYDQVAPPVLGGQQLGQRIPMILISPYAKENYISNTEMNHASMLGFIDYNWNLPALNRFVSISNLPLDMFNFNHNYSWGNAIRPPVNFSNNSVVHIPDSAYFTLNTYPSSVAGMFQMKPQIPFSDLGYNRTGSSDFNLSQVSSTYYVTKDTAYYPFYTTSYAIAGLAAVDIAIAFSAFQVARRRKK
jgi:phospholipase C